MKTPQLNCKPWLKVIISLGIFFLGIISSAHSNNTVFACEIQADFTFEVIDLPGQESIQVNFQQTSSYDPSSTRYVGSIWHFGDICNPAEINSISSSPSYTYDKSCLPPNGIVNVCYTARGQQLDGGIEDQCLDLICKRINLFTGEEVADPVNPCEIQADFAFEVIDLPGQESIQVNFQQTSSYDQSNTSYVGSIWHFGDICNPAEINSISSSPSYTYDKSCLPHNGIVNVCYTARGQQLDGGIEDQCLDLICKRINLFTGEEIADPVNPCEIQADFTFEVIDLPVQGSVQVNFQQTSSYDPSSTSYLGSIWHFGDICNPAEINSSSSSPSYTYNKLCVPPNGIVNVCYTARGQQLDGGVEDQCLDLICKRINLFTCSQAKKVLDASQELKPELLRVFPNPASKNVQFNFEPNTTASLELVIYDINQRILVKLIPNQYATEYHWDIPSSIENGIYWVTIQKNGIPLSSQKLMINR